MLPPPGDTIALTAQFENCTSDTVTPRADLYQVTAYTAADGAQKSDGLAAVASFVDNDLYEPL